MNELNLILVPAGHITVILPKLVADFMDF